MKTVVKKSLSMDAEVASRLEAMAKKLKKSFSRLVTEASTELLRKLEEEELGEAYKRYWADPKNRKEADEIYADFRKIMIRTWPKQ